eukprot:913584_1
MIAAFRHLRWRLLLLLNLSIFALSEDIASGTPVDLQMSGGAKRYFDHVIEDGTKAVTISVTRVGGTGDPDLYVSLSATNHEPHAPCSEATCHKAIAYGDDSVTVPASELTTGQRIYIGVTAVTAGSFSLLVRYDAVFALVTGRPQSDMLALEQSRFYSFHVANTATEVTFSLRVVLGMPHVFVSSTATVSHNDAQSYHWALKPSHGAHLMLIHIQKNNTYWPADNTFSLEVLAFGRLSELRYSIVAEDYSTQSSLLGGVPRPDKIATLHQSHFFKFDTTGMTIDSPNCTAMFILTGSGNGDPDLYVSKSADVPRPDAQAFSQAVAADPNQTNIYSSTTSVTHTDFITFPAEASKVYYIGVYAFTAPTYYSIVSDVVCPNQRSLVQLSDGLSQFGYLKKKQSQLYMLSFNEHADDVRVSATPVFGDPDIYLGFHDETLTDFSDFPSTASYTWRQMRYGADSIRINSTDTNYCKPSNNGQCSLVILVSVFTESAYFITATSEHGFVSLAMGRTIRSTLNARDYDYYTIQTDSTDVLTIRVKAYSGDPDLYVATSDWLTAHSLAKPDRATGHYVWSAKTSKDDVVVIRPTDSNRCQTPGCYYVIGVFAFTSWQQSIEYDVTASLGGNGNAVMLQSGVSVDGYAEGETMPLYHIAVSDTTFTGLHVTVFATVGSCNVYVANNPESVISPANSTSYQWHSTAVGTVNDLQIGAGGTGTTDLCVPGTPGHSVCEYSILVVGRPRCNFSVTATPQSSQGGEEVFVTLQDGVGSFKQISTSTRAVFMYSFMANQQITVTMSTVTGSPLMQTTFTSPRSHPDATDVVDRLSDYRGTSVTYDCDVLRTHISGASEGVLYLVATPLDGQPTSLSVSVQSSNCAGTSFSAIELTDGMAQFGMLDGTASKFFWFLVPEHVSELEIDLGDLQNPATVHSKFCGTQNHECFSRVETDYTSHSLPGQNQINITDIHSGFYAFMVSSSSATRFTISVSTGRIATLSLGTTVDGSVQARHFKYYQLTMAAPSDAVDLNIVVTRVAGDPDLYVSRADLTCPASSPVTCDPRPTQAAGTYQYKSRAWLSDSVSIPYANLCPSDHGQTCVYYIGIYGFGAAQFRLAASLAGRVALQNGVPLHGSLPAPHSADRYFYIPVVGEETAITISVAVETGNPNLFVKQSHDVVTGWPTKNDSDWHSQNFFTSEQIVISPSDPKFCRDQGCVYHIMVYAASASNYTITVSSENEQITQLISGAPMIGSSLQKNQSRYYYLDLREAHHNITIACTPTNGDPDLFVALNTPHHPSATDSQWKSRHYGADVVSINDAAVGVYYIAVTAYSNTTQYTLLAYTWSSEVADCILLQDASLQHAVLPPHVEMCYMFQVSEPNLDMLTFSLAPEYGDPDLYVNRVDFGVENVTEHRPHQGDSASYNWSAVTLGSDELAIQKPKAGIYLLTVYSYSPTGFYLSVSKGLSAIQLSEGVPLHGQAAKSNYALYHVHVAASTSPRPLTISVTPLSGDPDLYVANIAGVDKTHHNYSAVSSAFSDSVTIAAEEVKKFPDWYIAVYGYSNCSFTVVASYAEVLRLPIGVPQIFTVNASVTQYFNARVSSNELQFVVTVSPLHGNAAVMLSTSRQPEYNKPETYDIAARNFSTPNDIKILPVGGSLCPGHEEDGGVCVFRIGCHGTRATNKLQIVASVPSTPIQLQGGAPQRSYVEGGMYQYFSFEVRDQQSVVGFVITQIYGDTAMFISVTENRPTNTSHTWKNSASMVGPNPVFVEYTDQRFSVGMFYVGVLGTTSSKFTLTATDSPVTPQAGDRLQVVLLYDGVPQANLLESGKFSVYEFHIDEHLATGAGVVVTLAVNYGEVDLIVAKSTGDKDFVPTEGAHSDASGHVFIDEPCTSCSYRLKVTAASHSFFSLTVATSSLPQLVQAGQMVEGHVSARKYVYYRFDVPGDLKAEENATVVLTAKSGDPDIIMSASFTDKPFTASSPKCANGCLTASSCNPGCVWTARKYGSDVLSLDHLVAGSTYFLGVYGFYESNYALSVSYQNIHLIDGFPVYGVLDVGQSQFYSFRASSLHQSVFYNLKLISGEATMYITTSAQISELNDNTLGPMHYQWSTDMPNATQSNGQLEIRASDAKACATADCAYYARVQNRGLVVALYDLCASTGNCFLADGNPTNSYVENSAYKYFRFMGPKATPEFVHVVVTVLTGRVQLFVSTDSANVAPTANNCAAPKCFHSDLAADSDRGAQVLINTAPGTTAQMYHIGVLGVASSTFQVVVSTQSVQLTADWPQDGSPRHNGYFWFQIPENEKKHDLTLRILPPRNGDMTQKTFDLLVSRWFPSETQAPPALRPNTTTPGVVRRTLSVGYDWVFQPDNATSLYMAGAFYYLTVINEQFDRSYQIELDSQYAYAKLEFGRTSDLGDDLVHQDEYRYYELILDADVEPAKGLAVKLETCRGDTALYVARRTARPSAAVFDWSSAKVNEMHVVEFKGRNVDPLYRIGVFGRKDSQFRLSAFSPDDQGPDVSSVRDQVLPKETSAGEVEVTFPLATSPTRETLTYEVYVSKKSDEFVMYSECGLAYVPDIPVTPKESGDQHLVAAFTELEIGSSYVFSVLVRDSRGNVAVYQPKVFEVGNGGVAIAWVLGIGIPLVVVAAVAILYLTWRNRRLSRELQIEVDMEDVPKAALRKAVRGPISSRHPRQYTRLLVDDESDGEGNGRRRSSSDYMPPI